MADNQEYFESEDFREILEKYETSVKSGQSLYMDADDLADIADFYQYNGRMEEAENAIELALQYNPDAIGPLLYKAREALAASDFKKAREYAEHIKATDTLEALYFEGEILICEGRVEQADQLFREQLKEMMPDEQMDYVYDVANVFSDYNIYDKAFEWMARSQGDNSEDFKELMARILFGLGKYKDSERIFNELIDKNPYSKRYWNALASAQFMNEDYGAAITSSEFATAIDPDDADSILSKANSPRSSAWICSRSVRSVHRSAHVPGGYCGVPGEASDKTVAPHRPHCAPAAALADVLFFGEQAGWEDDRCCSHRSAPGMPLHL